MSSGQNERPRFGGTVIPAQHIQFHAAPAPPPAPAPRAEPCQAKPQITVIKEGDTVRAIEIVCICGEMIRLDCEY